MTTSIGAPAVPTALHFIYALSSHGLKHMVTGSVVPMTLGEAEFSSNLI